jgi:hypothetical protein
VKQQMRKTVRGITAGMAAVAATVGLSLAVADPALAAQSNGASCKLSANWTVKFSANFTAVSSSRETTHYLVMNSPGAIKQWNATIYQAGVVKPLWGPLAFINPDNLDRLNTTVTGNNLLVDMEVWGGNGHCAATVYLY